MSTINDLLKVCVELAKVENPTLCAIPTAVILTERLQAPYPTIVQEDLCVFTWKTETGFTGQAGQFCYADHDELVFGRVGNIAGHTYRVWRGVPGLVITRVRVTAPVGLAKRILNHKATR